MMLLLMMIILLKRKQYSEIIELCRRVRYEIVFESEHLSLPHSSWQEYE